MKIEKTSKERRKFLKKAGTTAAAVPAAAILLSLAGKPALAQSVYGGGQPGIGIDLPINERT
jgi:hypothetical protein